MILSLNKQNLNFYGNCIIIRILQFQIQLMSQQEKPIKKVVQPYQSIKFFISSLNTFFGHHLVPRLRNDHLHPDNPNRIIGTTIHNEKYDIPVGVRKVINTQKVKFFQDVILNSDVIIYNLLQCDLKQAEFVISTLKIHPFTENKTLICLSNVMCWAKTPPKQKKEGQQEEADENPPEQPDSEQQGAAQPPQNEEKKTYVRFTDKDYALRKPSPEYQKIKSIQTLCLAAGNAKPNLRSYVICSGLLYGEGEGLLSDYFMQARLQIPPSLPVYGKGKNRMPTVHIADLVTYIQKTIEKKPALPYILAIDHNPKPTQRKIVEAISKGIGTGNVQLRPIDINAKGIAELTINLRMKPTMVFAKLEEQQAAIEAEEGSQIVRFKFNWRTKEGIQKSIELLRQQFNKVHNLHQQKIFIIGPPGSGKSHYAKNLSKKYYLPHITIVNVIAQVKELKSELGQEIKNYLTEKKEAEIQAKQTQYDELKEKLKKIPKDQRQALPPFDPESVDVRLSDQLVYKCFKWRLNQNDCLNRGYVLDGYPRRYEDAKQLFLAPPPVAEGEQPDQNAKKVIEKRLVPTKLIVLKMSDEQIIERIQKLPQQQIIGTHLTQKKIRPLLKRYRNMHNSQSGEFVVEDFFKQNNIPCHHASVGPQTEAILQSLVKKVKGNEPNQQHLISSKLQQQKTNKQQNRNQMNKKQKIVRDIQHEDYMMKKQNEQNQEREILDKKSLALRKYLDINLVPILSEGIVELLNTFPKDPVDTLAEFLFRNSLKVPNPDPSTFDF